MTAFVVKLPNTAATASVGGESGIQHVIFWDHRSVVRTRD